MKLKDLLRAVVYVTMMTLPCQRASAQAESSLRQQMEIVKNEHHVNFVYDASLNLDRPHRGGAVGGVQLKEALRRLFGGTDIEWSVKGAYVMLKTQTKATPRPTARRHTVSGYVRDEHGETLLNAAIYDATTHTGTMTNEHGFYSLTLPEGSHELRISFIGYDTHRERISLNSNRQLDVVLKEGTMMDEVVVTADMSSPVVGTQMGKRSLSANDIKTEFALFSSPDVVKALQRLSGVQEGIELASGLYVHGGNNDENLFLLDGTPLYQVNHSLGLFSSFNTDVVKNVDFYKSGFPARYGGRLSSVADVRTNDGNWQQLHGCYRLGLLDGSVQMDGPIRLKSDRQHEARGEVRGTDFGTSFNVGLRRSWLDLLTRPAFAIANHYNDEEKISLSYAFHDLNLKLTHLFSRRSQLSLSVYSGRDMLRARNDWHEDAGSSEVFDEHNETKFSWGNVNAAINWRYQLTPQLLANFTAVYTHNHSQLKTREDDSTTDKDGVQTEHYLTDFHYLSAIYDAGYRTEFDYRPSPRHHIRFGHDYTCHVFRPQTQGLTNLWSSFTTADTLTTKGRNRHTVHEATVYGEDLLTLSDRWSMNGGLNVSLFSVDNHLFFHADPRLALKYQVADNLSVKASYTMMSQYVHKISNAMIDLPTDYWVPITGRLRPMYSHQMAMGAYWQPHRQWLLSVEGYYKRSHHLLQYNSWAGLVPPAGQWDKHVMDGQGRYYGLEVDATYHGHRLRLDAAYTLSWNERRFDEFYDQWYYDKFDNRHKVNLSLRYQIGKKAEMFAAWTYHTGNHLTFPTQYVQLPELPDGKPASVEAFERQGYLTGEEANAAFIYERPNNITLPAYHRLDIGFNFHHTTKHGHERIWNISVYNAYCHLNPLWVDIEYRERKIDEVNLADQQRFKLKPRAFIPVIPSFSYTIKF